MQRRNFNRASAGALGLLIWAACRQAHALSLGDISNADAGKGLKTALEKGVVAAVSLLGTTDGFLGNPKVRIPLPGYLEDASKLLKNFGQGKRIDDQYAQLDPGMTLLPGRKHQQRDQAGGEAGQGRKPFIGAPAPPRISADRQQHGPVKVSRQHDG